MMLSEEKIKKLSDNLNAANVDNLLQYKQVGVVSKVEILASQNSCEHCKKQQGRIFEIDEALKARPLPCEECSHEIGYCRCTYIPLLTKGISAT